MPGLAPEQWVIGALSALFVGIAKTGVPGLGMLAIPMMVIAVGDARLSAGWLLPILCTADLFAVYSWRKHAAAYRLMALAPWVLVGLGLGAVALRMPESRIRPLLGGILLAMLVLYLVRRLRPSLLAESPHGAPYGVAAGFATTVANAAGPVMSVYLLSQRLHKEEFLATGAWFFFVINLLKIPIYVWNGLFSRESLLFDLAVLPAVIAGALAGCWLVKRVSNQTFEAAVLLLAAVSTLLMFRH